MLLELSADQESFRVTTARFLGKEAPSAELRRLRHDPVGYDPAVWRRGAALGWTSLLVDEADGGGSVGEHGLLDLCLVAHEFGRVAAPGPLLQTNVVAGALSTGGGHPEVLDGLLAGELTAAWSDATVEISTTEDEVVLDGTLRPVGATASTDYLLVTGRDGSDLTQVVVPTSTPGVTVTPLKTVDLTQRFSAVTFDAVRLPAGAVLGQVGKGHAELEAQLRHALVIANAESVGAMHTAFEMTLSWLADRYSFGRALNSYQALKHRAADMKTWLEASHAIADESARAVATGAPNADVLVSAAKAYIGHYGAEMLQQCVQLHGGIGVTFEHDLHLVLRRHTVNRALFGTPAEHRARITDLVERQESI